MAEEPRIIDAVVEPHDIAALNDEELAIVAAEIREQIVATTSHTGGHVASSLGAVEIILAMHAELNTPRDKIVYDVGHQAYAHKILTGRLAQFDTLRQAGGVSAFPNPAESEYDVHPSGHASDSLSIALGLAKARDLRGSDERVVALIGDASISGGMALEALNQIGQEQTQLVIVLNDNEMSISPNVGALSRHFSELRASNEYRDTRNSLQEALAQAGPLQQALLAGFQSAKGSAKHLLLPESSMLFEHMGITCMAPVDGHNIAALRRALRAALASHGPTLVHVVTRKGHGYAPAEERPELFHGVGPFDAKTGVPRCGKHTPTYSEVFGEALVREAEANEQVVAITAAMCAGTGLSEFAERFPNRFSDVGIAEEHAVGLAAGFAAGGAKPVAAVYSTFLQRAIDQLVIDVALPNTNVVLAVDRAGIVGEDGVTHNGSYDLAFLRMIPHLRVLAPSSGAELASALHTALALGGPFAIRYPKGAAANEATWQASTNESTPAPELLEPGRSRTLRDGDDVAILAFGSMVAPALEAADALASEDGISARVVDMRWAKPLDEDAIRAAAGTQLVVTAEEGALAGGVGEGVLGVLAHEGIATPALTLGIPDHFVQQGSRAQLLHSLGLDAEGIARAIRVRLLR